MSVSDPVEIALSAEQKQDIATILSWIHELERADSYAGFTLLEWSRALPKGAAARVSKMLAETVGGSDKSL